MNEDGDSEEFGDFTEHLFLSGLRLDIYFLFIEIQGKMSTDEILERLDRIENLERLDRIEILERLDRIEAVLAKLVETLGSVEKSCENMDGHIGFVQSVYHTVRAPLDYVCRRFGLSSRLPYLPCVLQLR